MPHEGIYLLGDVVGGGFGWMSVCISEARKFYNQIMRVVDDRLAFGIRKYLCCIARIAVEVYGE